MTLCKTYDPASVEADVWQWWEQADAFRADPHASGPAFSMVIPPPNVTAALHLGHALNNTLQDVLVRWRRMCGDNAVWLPGTDHAGIATQTVVDKRLQAEGEPSLVDYKKLEAEGKAGREPFVAKVQAWKDEYEQTITNQLKKMGCSCDWSRQAFTMDDVRARAVREAFFQLFKDRLIYRGKRLVNWDPATQTALADDEVEMAEIDGHFWYMRYPIIDDRGADTGQFATVATTRPETMLGDTAVAVNPEDGPRAKYIGRHVRLPIVNRVIPIIGDDYVVPPDPESDDPMKKYASGFLKVTPAHDPNDYEIGLRHSLPMINVMGPDGSISKDHGWLDWDDNPHDEFLENLLGMDRYEAREAIVEWFRRNGLLADVKPYRHSVGHSYRSHVPVEPYLSDQWYVKVTDDRLAGAALRAMAEDQRGEGDCVWADEHPFTRGATSTNRARKQAVGARHGYFITWSSYGSHAHGDSRGSVHHDANLPGEPLVTESSSLEDAEADLMTDDPMSLDATQRASVRDTIVEVCRHRGWELLAVNARTEHVHVVVLASDKPEKVLNDLKSYATRRMREAGLVSEDARVWARHGSTRWLNTDAAMGEAIEYVLEKQGDDLGGVYRVDEAGEARRPLPHGRGSLEDGALRFTPDRYARTFQHWHENIRDWCISRQLWWGHRIPVWSVRDLLIKPNVENLVFEEEGYSDFNEYRKQLFQWQEQGRLVIREERSSGEKKFDFVDALAGAGSYSAYVCIRNEDDTEIVSSLADKGFVQDPDVLDTWFSSALWPLSTMGWPDDTPELRAWNPTTVLSTAREIITLWVSRMVMFNIYFRGCLPFRDVFIHAMIQDGEGRKMSKSLGNGVDPLDIIWTHGADAMRFTLVSMTTHTQDVRMPVELDETTGRNTSPKFDNGRNFCNKLWNAGRFALGHLQSRPGDDAARNAAFSPGSSGGDFVAAAGLADRWILSRLAQTIAATDDALARYEFSRYAQTLYDFFWRDLCDWYLEAIKPMVRADTDAGAAARATLAACLDASLRLLHPITPFVTERLWAALNEVAPGRSARGLSIEPSDRCMTARWPRVEDALVDAQAEQAFSLQQAVTGAIRNLRSEYHVPPRRQVTVRVVADGPTCHTLSLSRQIIRTLAGVDEITIDPDQAIPEDAAKAVVGAVTVAIEGLIDPDAERRRLDARHEELVKDIKALESRLGNQGYVDKAPAHLVQQTRDRLAEKQRELETVTANLERLSGIS